ncbi:hypothetical protein D6T65_15340 [Arthrobacter frigidicola]|nr:hypothetical protein D6T65_15340 [Arthrobacter frigidicola]
MTVQSRPGFLPRLAAVLTGVTLLSAGFTPVSPALAVDGPAPQSQTRTVVGAVHADAVSLFLDDGALALDSQADLPGAPLHARYNADQTIFNISDAARTTIPAGPIEAVTGPAGGVWWVAPETRMAEVLWPGMSTDSLPANLIDGKTASLTLSEVDGPGTVSVWDSANFAPRQLFHSNPADSSFPNTIKLSVPQHRHANWGFSAPGTYKLTFTASASVQGVPQSTTQTYTFVVGPVPAPIQTAVSLAVDPAGPITVGQSVRLSAAVEPATAAGWIEFSDGSTVLGHEPVTGGAAALTTNKLALGQRNITARFVPAWTNDFTASTASTTIAVTEETGGEFFHIAGMKERYTSGEKLDLRVVGVTLQEGQEFRWLLKRADEPNSAGSDITGTLTAPTPDWDLTSSYNGLAFTVQVVERQDWNVTVIQEAPWVTLTVTGEDKGSGQHVTVGPLPAEIYMGDPLTVVPSSAPLTEGQRYELVSRSPGFFNTWTPIDEQFIEQSGTAFMTAAGPAGFHELAVQIVDAQGEIRGQSAPVAFESMMRELQITGGQAVYRAGDTLNLTSSLYPARDDSNYTWMLYTPEPYSYEPLEADGGTLSLKITPEMKNAVIILSADDPHFGMQYAFADFTINVTDAAPGEQIVFFIGLTGHYHQGANVAITLAADPLATDTDIFSASWKRPDQEDFVPLPLDGNSLTLAAEQALHGTVFRGELHDKEGNLLATAPEATLLVDDHGADPHQKMSITGGTEAPEGEAFELTAEVSPSSVLQRHRWTITSPTAATETLITNGPGLSLAATKERHGASIAAELIFDDGTAYVKSPALQLSVTAPAPPTDPDVPPTDPEEPVDPELPPTEPEEPVDPELPPASPEDDDLVQAPADPQDPLGRQEAGADAGGSQARGPSSTPSALAVTGAAVTPLLTAGALLAVGGALLLFARRRLIPRSGRL